MLRRVAYVIRKQLRAFDLAYRVGGEEFLVVLAGAERQEGTRIAEQIRDAVEQDSVVGVSVTISCGVAGSARGSAFDYRGAFADCDAALYVAKSEGRNQVSVVDKIAVLA